jgi:protein-disulfide isomerase
MCRRIVLITLITIVAVCAAASVPSAQNAPASAQPRAGGSAATPPASAAPGDQDQLLKSTEAFVRDLYAWGPDHAVKLGPLSQSPAPEFYKVPVVVTYNGQSDTGEVYVSKDGKTVLRGDIFDLRKDPYAGVRDHLHPEGNPSTGPANAPITLVEFSDFECPHCREFHEAFAAIQAKFPQIRLVYKDYPLADIHPWAETAAIGARCAFMQSPGAFWKMHDDIFKNQDNITTDNAWDQLNGFATAEGLNAAAFKTCLASPEAAKAVDANRADGGALGVNSTPTVYVNGRPVAGGDPSTVMQYIQYELARPKP